jgi:hypothetical protein
MDDDEVPVAEFVDYCRLQARLCAGTIDTLQDEIAALLDELDDDLDTLRERLADSGAREGTDSAAGTESAMAPGPDGVDTDAVADTESEVERKQSLVAAKQARLEAYQDLASGYADLAAELRDDVTETATAVERIVEFEVERDAPAYFDERETLAETAAKSDGE